MLKRSLGPHPDPAATRTNGAVAARLPLRPFFLPFAGCGQRCVFCDQRATTGRAPVTEEAPSTLPGRLADFLEELAAREVPPFELGLFGGTFTRLPTDVQRAMLLAAARFPGMVAAVRCSTRPDCVDVDALKGLRDLGLGLVELGVQSFDDRCLATAGRGCDGETARRGCEAVLGAGLGLGIQLMPGLPGWEEADQKGGGVLARDAATAAALGPTLVRMYPCVVLRDAPLAEDWRAGRFRPMPTERAVEEVAGAVGLLWAAGVPVARIGLPPEPGMLEGLLAGPWLPDMGFRARSLALRRTLLERVGQGESGAVLLTPRRWLAEVVGPSGQGRRGFADRGLSIRPWDGVEFALGLPEG